MTVENPTHNQVTVNTSDSMDNEAYEKEVLAEVDAHEQELENIGKPDTEIEELPEEETEELPDRKSVV